MKHDSGFSAGIGQAYKDIINFPQRKKYGFVLLDFLKDGVLFLAFCGVIISVAALI